MSYSCSAGIKTKIKASSGLKLNLTDLLTNYLIQKVFKKKNLDVNKSRVYPRLTYNHQELNEPNNFLQTASKTILQ